MPPARPLELASKRLTGWLNWHLHRGRGALLAHARDALVADIAAQAPDHVAVTGDLVNLALAAEFAPAAEWLTGLGAPADVSLVPGNHDAYVPGALARAISHWGPHMRGDSADAPEFPYLRRRGPVALVGVSSAIATAPFLATGRVGGNQLCRLHDILHQLGTEGAARVVLIHHPPTAGTARRAARLTDAAALRTVLQQTGAELVLHGHTHRADLGWLPGPGAAIPVVGVPSASLAPTATRRGAGWNLLAIEGRPGAWTITRSERGFPPAGHAIVELSRTRLAPPDS